jgi:hypothetical protein
MGGYYSIMHPGRSCIHFSNVDEFIGNGFRGKGNKKLRSYIFSPVFIQKDKVVLLFHGANDGLLLFIEAVGYPLLVIRKYLFLVIGIICILFAHSVFEFVSAETGPYNI